MWFFGEATKRAKEGKGSRTRGGDEEEEEEGDSGNSVLAGAGDVRQAGRAAQSACSPPARASPPNKQCHSIIRLMQLRRRPAHWKSNSYGTGLNTVQ